MLPIRRKHYCLAALLHDVFRNPHRQKVYLKPKQKKRTSRFLSTLRFLFGAAGRSRTGTVSLPADFESATSANSITAANVTMILYNNQNKKSSLFLFFSKYFLFYTFLLSLYNVYHFYTAPFCVFYRVSCS